MAANISFEEMLSAFKKGSYDDILSAVAAYGESENDHELNYYIVDRENGIAHNNYINWDSNCGCTVTTDSIRYSSTKPLCEVEKAFSEAWETGEYNQFCIDIEDNGSIPTLHTHVVRYEGNKKVN